jgi:hypothetical protein
VGNFGQYLKVLLAAIVYLEEGQPAEYTFSNGYSITVTIVTGPPQHLSFGQVILVVEQVFLGVPGTLQFGDVQVTIAGPGQAKPTQVITPGSDTGKLALAPTSVPG